MLVYTSYYNNIETRSLTSVTPARKVLSEIDLEQIADEVFFVLDSLDVRDCWNRAGNSRGVSYTLGLARRLASCEAGCKLEPLWFHYGWQKLCPQR